MKKINSFFEITSELAYQWDAPLIILRDRFGTISNEYWNSGYKWIEFLDTIKNDLLGLVLPLELKTETHWRQSLYGLELLEWLRYSGDIESCVNLIPVLSASWQPLQNVLKRRFEPLIVSYGCIFTRLPDAMQNDNKKLKDFVQQVRGKEAFLYREREESLRRLAFGRAELVEQLTHHDLANDYFAAWRLWKGYLRALESVAQIRTKNAEANKVVKEAFESTSKVEFIWQDELKKKMRRPYFYQFCLSRKKTPVAPYPPVESAESITRIHVNQGLPKDTRILFVDDEFDKGMADVLLQILFGQHGRKKIDFTTKGPSDNEWVYSEPSTRTTRDSKENDRWARMVCVKDIPTAAHWLKYWGEANLFEPREKKFPHIAMEKTEEEWTKAWSRLLELDTTSVDSIEDVLGYSTTGKIDKPLSRPKSVNTFVFLDLRLKRLTIEDELSIENNSKKFINALKHQRPSIPILMITASRQTNKYTDIMEGTDDQDENFSPDGWLIKEAPDAMTDDTNSSHAAHYLLNFIHLSAHLNEWYRPSINWDQIKKAEYQEMRESEYFINCMNSIADRADSYLKNLEDQNFRKKNQYRKLLGSVLDDGKSVKFDIENHLVARRIAIWALIFTSDWTKGSPEWNAEQFLNKLSCRPIKREVKYPSHVLNFETDLYLGTYKPKLLEGLLKEEYDWLEHQKWPTEIAKAISKYLTNIREKENI